MMYSKEPTKVLVLSPDSSSSSLTIWLDTLSVVNKPSSVKPKEKKSTTIAILSDTINEFEHLKKAIDLLTLQLFETQNKIRS